MRTTAKAMTTAITSMFLLYVFEFWTLFIDEAPHGPMAKVRTILTDLIIYTLAAAVLYYMPRLIPWCVKEYRRVKKIRNDANDFSWVWPFAVVMLGSACLVRPLGVGLGNLIGLGMVVEAVGFTNLDSNHGFAFLFLLVFVPTYSLCVIYVIYYFAADIKKDPLGIL